MRCWRDTGCGQPLTCFVPAVGRPRALSSSLSSATFNLEKSSMLNRPGRQSGCSTPPNEDELCEHHAAARSPRLRFQTGRSGLQTVARVVGAVDGTSTPRSNLAPLVADAGTRNPAWPSQLAGTQRMAPSGPRGLLVAGSRQPQAQQHCLQIP